MRIRRIHRITWLAVACSMALPACSGGAPPVVSPTRTGFVLSPSPSLNLSLSADLQEAVTTEAILAHLRELERIADENDGNRAAGTSGHDASADYVAGLLREAGLDVREHAFEFPAFEQIEPATLAVPLVTGEPASSPVDGEDFKVLLYSPSGEVEAPVTSIGFDPDAGLGDRNGAGCEAADFAAFPRAHIALVQPGPCFRRVQLENAQGAGASALMVSYPEVGPGRVPRPTLLGPVGLTIPAISVTGELGLALASTDPHGAPTRLSVQTQVVQRPSRNVIAETPGGDPGRVLMVGGHLDSAIDGPGINDNGSGTATILEVATQLAALVPELRTRVRFAFWSAEELGLLGSTQYVDELTADQRATIVAYLNFDMLGSPNFVRYVYAEQGAPAGSEDLTRMFLDRFDALGMAAETYDLQGGSDHGPFLRAGIPIGGLFTGAFELKSQAAADTSGGAAGLPEDECYHLACDRVDHLGVEVLGEMADAVAHAVATLAG